MNREKNKTVVTVLTINVVVIIVIGLIVVGYFYKKRYDISELYMRITPEKIERDIKDFEVSGSLMGNYKDVDGFGEGHITDYEITTSENQIKVNCEFSYESSLGKLYVDNIRFNYKVKGLFNTTYYLVWANAEYTSSKFEYNKSPYLTPRQLLNYINRQQGTDYANVETVMLVSAGEQIDMYNPDYDFYYCVDELDALEYYVQFWHNDLTTDYIYVTVDWNENPEDWDVVASQTSTKKIHSDFLMLGMTKYMRADGYLDDSQMDTVCDVNNQILRNLNE